MFNCAVCGHTRKKGSARQWLFHSDCVLTKAFISNSHFTAHYVTRLQCVAATGARPGLYSNILWRPVRALAGFRFAHVFIVTVPAATLPAAQAEVRAFVLLESWVHTCI
jgi:hypothetical protein